MTTVRNATTQIQLETKSVLLEQNGYFARQLDLIEDPEFRMIGVAYQANFQRLTNIVCNTFGKILDTGFSTKDMPTMNFAPSTPSVVLTPSLQETNLEDACIEFLEHNLEVPPNGVQLSDVYTLIKKIGEGGSGRVYLARDNNLDIPCAIKVLRIFQEHDQRKFFSEIKITAKLRHPNIVNIFYANHIHKYYYYVMEYIDGESCDLILKRRAMSETEVISIAIPLAQAIEHAHHYNIIHRDIKPANVMIDQGKTVKVCDMGLAMIRALHTNPTSASSGRIRGTPVYMAPEQITGGGTLDERTDIYSYGMTLYHLLTRQVPYLGRNLQETFEAICNFNVLPKPPREIFANISESMEALILKCIQKRPESRFAKMSQVLSALQEIAKKR